MDPAESHDGCLRVGPLEVRVGEGFATAAGHAIVLSVRELGLLVALVRRAGHVVSREIHTLFTRKAPVGNRLQSAHWKPAAGMVYPKEMQ